MHIALTVHDKEGKQLEDFPVKVYKIKYSDELQTELEQKEEEERKNEPEAKPKLSPKKAETPTQPGGSNPGTPVSPPNAAVLNTRDLTHKFFDFSYKESAEEAKQMAVVLSKAQGLRIPIPASIVTTMRKTGKIGISVWYDFEYMKFLKKTGQEGQDKRIPYAERFTKEELEEKRERNELKKKEEEQKKEEEHSSTEEEQASKRRKLTHANRRRQRPACFGPMPPGMKARMDRGRAFVLEWRKQMESGN
jgi:hypothetical protein